MLFFFLVFKEDKLMSERFKVPVGIFVIFRNEDKVLLQLRQNCSFSGYWGFVGGHLDGNEQIILAAIREAKEEVGVDIRSEDLTLKTICHSNKGEEYIQFYFECCKWSGEIENKEPSKCECLVWHEWNKLPEKTCPYLKEAVKKINKGISFYEDEFDIKFKPNRDNSNSVKIMTIHASKGLEYPVCYFAGFDSKFNLSDIKERIFYDNKYGIIKHPYAIPPKATPAKNLFRPSKGSYPVSLLINIF